MKRSSKTPREPVIVAKTATWHITLDRETRDYCAIHEVGGLLGIVQWQLEATRLCEQYESQLAQQEANHV